MMPIVFCASLVPCDKPIAVAEKICALPKNALTKRGRANFCAGPRSEPMNAISANNAPISTKPITKPISGEVTIGNTTSGNRPFPSHQCTPPCHQISADQLLPAPASAAPQRPPTSACDELDGKPRHQVMRSQIVAPSSAQISTCGVTATTPESMSPDEIVLATAVPHNAPSRFVLAARSTAWPGLNTFVATTVAIELAVS